MATRTLADEIGKMARALKHCEKLLKKIEKDGKAIMRLNCTGIEFEVVKGDALYYKLQTTKAKLVEAINSFEIVKRETAKPSQTTTEKKRGRPRKIVDTSTATI